MYCFTMEVYIVLVDLVLEYYRVLRATAALLWLHVASCCLDHKGETTAQSVQATAQYQVDYL